MDFSSANSIKAGEAGSSRTSVGFKSGKHSRRNSRSKHKPNKVFLQFNQFSNLSPAVKRKEYEEEKQGSTIKRKLNEAVPTEGLP